MKPGLLFLVLALSLVDGPAAEAQQRPAAGDGPGALQDSDSADAGVSPGWAFARSVLIPGWGHAAVGSYTRGGFYFAVEAGTGWMLFKTISALGAARDRRDAIRVDAEARLRSQGVEPDSLAVLLEEDEELSEARSLVEAREQQREDWLAFGFFMLLLGGADAFVSAHLADFPEPVELNTRVAPSTGAVEVQLSLPWGGPGGWSGPSPDGRAKR